MPPVLTLNERGRSPFVLVCDHASNRIPDHLGDFGLTPLQRLDHIAWDPGALSVALRLLGALDAPLVYSTVSRLVIDCNRSETAPDLMTVLSERTRIAANENLSEDERRTRIARYHGPFHAAIDDLLDARAARGQASILVAVHSFTPIYRDIARPWPIGLIHGIEPRYTRALFEALKAEDPDLNVGWNQPYAALNGVTHTLETHGDGRRLDATMIEIRNDEILEERGVTLWANRLARCLQAARKSLLELPASNEAGQRGAGQGDDDGR